MIEIKNVTTGYSKDKPISKNITYTFKDEKIYGILGESGCGKTTLLKTIAGLIYPLDGEIYVDGKILTKAEKNDIYMMHQQYTSFDWLSCVENILITKRVKGIKITQNERKAAIDLLKMVGLEQCVDKYPSKLSGGQKQRLALARTLYANPKIILMDEPLSALDEDTREKMQEIIMTMHKNNKGIIIMVTHSKEEAKKMCDEIIEF